MKVSDNRSERMPAPYVEKRV